MSVMEFLDAAEHEDRIQIAQSAVHWIFADPNASKPVRAADGRSFQTGCGLYGAFVKAMLLEYAKGDFTSGELAETIRITEEHGAYSSAYFADWLVDDVWCCFRMVLEEWEPEFLENLARAWERECHEARKDKEALDQYYRKTRGVGGKPQP